jgi:stage II sporulation protein D
VRSRFRAGALSLLVALAAASCARMPAPRQAQPPPIPGAAPPARFELKGEPYVRIGLAWDLDSVVVIGDMRVFVPNSSDFDRVMDGIKIGIAPTGLVFGNPGDRVPPIPFTGDTLTIRPEHGTLRWNGKTWRGMLRVFDNHARGKLTLVDELPLETYLLGVVPIEIGRLTKELIEAGRAQAIAARSYTLYYLGRRASEGFDLFGTVEDQLYGPVESERPFATQCVEDTRGRIALYEGRPIRANYCSTCGGITAEVREAWPTPFEPYLESERDRENDGDYCAASPQYRWRERWTAAEFLANVERFAPMQGIQIPADTLGELLDVQVAARSVSGRVWRLLVRTTAGDVAIPAYSIRQVLRRGGQPGLILRSTLFKIDVRRDPATGRAIDVLASGAGSGHGVGLCQTGALGMARAGASAERILEHYYPHAVIERRY